MFTRLVTKAAVAGAMLLAAQAASAATFEFGKLAQTNERFWVNNSGTGTAGGVFNDATDTWTVDGIGVSAFGSTYTTGSGTPTTVGNFAYLDNDSNAKAGLGVCSSEPTPVAGQCDNSSDDNTGHSDNIPGGAFEFLTLTFTSAVSLADLVLYDDGHHLITSGKLGVSTGAFTGTLDDLIIGTTLLSSFGTSNVWNFAKIGGGVNFYINTAEVAAVPIPAAGLMLLGALGGLGAIRRRRKAA